MTKKVFLKRSLKGIAIVICLAGVTIFSGCGKDDPTDPNNPDNPGNNSKKRLVSYIYFAPLDNTLDFKYEYEYDSQNRPLKIKVTGDPAYGGTWNITYPNANTMRYDNNNLYLLYTLNNKGYAIKQETNVGGFLTNSVIEYENDYMKKTVNNTVMGGLTSTVTIDYYWNNGKLDLINQKTTGILNYEEKYTFTYSTVLYKDCNFAAPTIFGHIVPTSLQGKLPSHFVESETHESPSGNFLKNYRYETDTEGYITKVYGKANGGEERLVCEMKY